MSDSNQMSSDNVHWADLQITKQHREQRNGHKAFVIWLTGLPCAGKTSIAIDLQKMLFENNCQAFVLDGDNIRHGLNGDLGFTAEDREENIRRIGEVAKLFADAGTIVITAFISPYRADRTKVRDLLADGEFIEVFVKADVSVCEERDVKGLYKKARAGEIQNYTGVSAPYEEPQKPELIVDTEHQSVDDSANAILSFLKEKKYIK